jgi:hypothetical protein
MIHNRERARRDIGRRCDGKRRSRQGDERAPDCAPAPGSIQARRHILQESLGRQGFPGFGKELCQRVIEVAHHGLS